MRTLFRVPAARRRIYYALWRRILSAPVAYGLQSAHDISFSNVPTLVGLPVIKGSGPIRFGDDCTLASLRYSNPLGLHRACIFETLSGSDGGIGRITVGNRFSASGICVISAAKIEIGNNVSVGANVTILDTDLHPTAAASRNRQQDAAKKAILIGHDVWIGMNAVILKGVSIGNGAVIAANAVITRNVPPQHLAYGNPCLLKAMIPQVAGR